MEDLGMILWSQELDIFSKRHKLSWETRKSLYDFKWDIENDMPEMGYDADYLDPFNGAMMLCDWHTNKCSKTSNWW